MDKTYTVEIPGIGKITADYDTFNKLRGMMDLAEVEAWRKFQKTKDYDLFIQSIYKRDYQVIVDARRIILEEVIESEE